MLHWHNGEVRTLWLASGRITGRPVAIYPTYDRRNGCRVLPAGLAKIFDRVLDSPRRVTRSYDPGWNFTLVVRVRGQGTVLLPVDLHWNPQPTIEIAPVHRVIPVSPYIVLIARSLDPLSVHLAVTYSSNSIPVGPFGPAERAFLRRMLAGDHNDW